jgi:hypothetical protein
VLRANLKWKLVSQVVGSCLVLLLAIGMTSCKESTDPTSNPSVAIVGDRSLTTTDGPLAEVNTPDLIAKLAPTLDKYQPQVQILSPRPDEILSDDRVTVKLQVNDLPLFKHPELGLGNHLHVILDKKTYQGVYDLSQPLVFKNLAAGTHSLRVFASRPWHESFKNEGAYAQTTFHVLTKTPENNPNPQQPLLTYSRPVGTYSAEPIMLDYYLTNAPSHLVATGSQESLSDWRIRVTVNDQRFILDRWSPIYLQGFKQGKNWVRLELVDDRGNPIANVYNDTVAILTYNPQTKDTLAKLIRGEIAPNLARTLVDPDYVVAKPAPSVVPTPIFTPTPSPSPVIIEPAPTVTNIPTPSSTTVPNSIASPPILPSLAPTPAVNNPEPAIAIPIPAPVTTDSPVVIAPPHQDKIPTIPNPPVPQLLPSIAPTPMTTPSIPVVKDPPPPIATPSPVPSQNPPVAIASEPTPTGANIPEKNWRTQAIELTKVAGAKIREFTNSIPPKAQRFGHNVQIWVGKAIDLVQSWRNQ